MRRELPALSSLEAPVDAVTFSISVFERLRSGLGREVRNQFLAPARGKAPIGCHEDRHGEDFSVVQQVGVRSFHLVVALQHFGGKNVAD
jgi:hypothetical protein